MLTAARYVGESQHQTAEVVQAIRYGTGLVPAVILLIGIALLTQLPVDHKREREIQKAVKELHSTTYPNA